MTARLLLLLLWLFGGIIWIGALYVLVHFMIKFW
jgi:hypothetical protein